MKMTRSEYDMNAMGQKMQYYRKKRKLSVEDVRRYMEFSSVQAIYKWESGKCFPTADNLMALAELYQVESEELMPKRAPENKEIKIEPLYFLIKCNNRHKNVDYMVCV